MNRKLPQRLDRSSIVRTFPIQASPEALFDLASQPLLAPRYLNFLRKIDRVDSAHGQGDWTTYRGDVAYRSLLKLTANIEHKIDPTNLSAHVRHASDLATFHAVFVIGHGVVSLTCTYEAKAPIIRWIVAKLLDRVLVQVAQAMDRYAASPFHLNFRA